MDYSSSFATRLNHANRVYGVQLLFCTAAPKVMRWPPRGNRWKEAIRYAG